MPAGPVYQGHHHTPPEYDFNDEDNPTQSVLEEEWEIFFSSQGGWVYDGWSHGYRS